MSQPDPRGPEQQPPAAPLAVPDAGLSSSQALERQFDESDPDVAMLRELTPTDRNASRRAFSALLRALSAERRS